MLRVQLLRELGRRDADLYKAQILLILPSKMQIRSWRLRLMMARANLMETCLTHITDTHRALQLSEAVQLQLVNLNHLLLKGALLIDRCVGSTPRLTFLHRPTILASQTSRTPSFEECEEWKRRLGSSLKDWKKLMACFPQSTNGLIEDPTESLAIWSSGSTR